MEVWLSPGGALVGPWWRPGGGLVEPWWRPGGALVEACMQCGLGTILIKV